jgi:hypothetical protein
MEEISVAVRTRVTGLKGGKGCNGITGVRDEVHYILVHL